MRLHEKVVVVFVNWLTFGMCGEHESIGKLSRDSQSGVEKFSESETQNVLIFNESSAFVSESEGSWNLRVSSFELVQAIYVATSQ